MQNILETKNLSKVYGFRGNHKLALDQVSMTVKKGEFLGIMGPSGSGKTTLLNVISTIDKPTSGLIRIDDEDIYRLKRGKLADFRAKKLGFIFQDYNLIDVLSIRENIALSLTINKKDPTVIDSIIEEKARILGISDILEKFPHEVSGGQKQRAAAARAIINNPSLILADEPTGALDSRSSENMLKTMKHLNEEEQATILMVTHDAFAASFCDRILFLKDGQIFTEIYSKGDRKLFYKAIMDVVAILGGVNDHVL